MNKLHTFLNTGSFFISLNIIMASASKRSKASENRQFTEAEVQRFLEDEILATEVLDSSLFSEEENDDYDEESEVEVGVEIDPDLGDDMAMDDSNNEGGFDRAARLERHKQDNRLKPKSVEDALNPEFFLSLGGL